MSALSARAARTLEHITAHPGLVVMPIQSSQREAITILGLVKRGLVTVDEQRRCYPVGGAK